MAADNALSELEGMLSDNDPNAKAEEKGGTSDALSDELTKLEKKLDEEKTDKEKFDHLMSLNPNDYT